MLKKLLAFGITCCWGFSLLEGEPNSLLRDLEIARYWDAKLCEGFPITYNHVLSTGYFTTPSARMDDCGMVGFGIADVPPYLHWNARIQPFRHLEVSANYRIFCGVEDAGLSPYGFGDYADRGANFKLAFFTPKDSDFRLPGLAFGAEDFMGSKKFFNWFIVGTQVLIDYGLEGSFGWGTGRYTHGPSRGFFGAIAWFPWYHCSNRWLQYLSLAAEYDPTNYKDPEREPHPDGRVSHTPINYGVKYKIYDHIDLSASRIRGDAFAFSGSFNYNLGACKGLLPKIHDPLPYKAPVDHEPLGCSRPESVMIQSINFALEEQGFRLMKAFLEHCVDSKGCPKCRLWVEVINQCYREERVVRMRLQHLFASLIPSNVTDVIVVLESYGLPTQQYVYSRDLLMRYAHNCIGPYEFDILTPRQEVSSTSKAGKTLFCRKPDLWRGRLSPRVETFFGSAKGKFKYDLGIRGQLEGYLPYDTFYSVQASVTVNSTMNNLGDVDRYNPSQLPIVLTDYVRYRQEGNFSTDCAYLQKSWNFGRGWFGRAAGGYFQVNYAGLAGEILWYPTHSLMALGVEGALLKKRSFHGLGFQSTLRQLDGFTPTFRPYQVLNQYFFNLYFDFPELSVAAKISVGGFLAHDKGVRLEVVRYFESGLRIVGWITFTDAGDFVNGERYFNRGIAFELPFDLFYRRSSRRIWSYGLAAWLRDAGAFTTTGIGLFDIINQERQW